MKDIKTKSIKENKYNIENISFFSKDSYEKFEIEDRKIMISYYILMKYIFSGKKRKYFEKYIEIF